MKTVRALSLLSLFGMAACASNEAQMPTVDYVDINRFMGDWYVIASIPTFLEKGAHNAIESYAVNPDGTIATTFRFRDGAFDGKAKEYTPKGFIKDTSSNAVWGMRFIWPIKADYRIVYLDDAYTLTVIGRNKRDFVWIMAREPEIPEAAYKTLIDFVASLGYDVTKIKRVPQKW